MFDEFTDREGINAMTKSFKKIVTGTITIENANVAQQLPNVKVPRGVSVVIRARVGNSGIIYIGGDENVSEDNGFALNAGDGIRIRVDNLSRVWVFGTVAGDKLDYIFESE